MGNIGIGAKTIAVYQQMLRTHTQGIDRPMHGQDRGIEDIETVNLFRRNDTYGPRHSLPLDDRAQGTPLAVGQLLGIIQQLITEIRGQDDRSGIDRSCQTTTAGLITAGFYDIFMTIGQ